MIIISKSDGEEGNDSTSESLGNIKEKIGGNARREGLMQVFDGLVRASSSLHVRQGKKRVRDVSTLVLTFS